MKSPLRCCTLAAALLLACAAPLAAQFNAATCLPDNPIVLARGADAAAVERQIDAQKTVYEPAQIKALRDAIARCNREMETRISALNLRFDAIVGHKKDLLAVRDVSKLKEQIEEKKRGRDEIRQNTDKQLGNLAYRSIYLAALQDIDPLAPKESFQQATRVAIAPEAVAALNGAFISSLTQLVNNQVEFDRVRQMVSGAMEIEKDLIQDKVLPGKKMYVRLCMVKVSPLQRPLSSMSTGGTSLTPPKALIVNALTRSDYDAPLRDLGLREELLAELRAAAEAELEAVRLHNANVDAQQGRILRDSEQRIAAISAEIERLEALLRDGAANVERIIAQHTRGVSFNKNDIAGSVNAALGYLDRRLDSIRTAKLVEKEKELIVKGELMSIAGDKPSKAFADNAMKYLTQIGNEHSQVKNFYQKVELENAQITGFEQGMSADAYREVNRFWVFPTLDDENYFVYVVAQFRMREPTNIPPGPKPNTPQPPVQQPVQQPARPRFTVASSAYEPEMVFVEGGTAKLGDNFGDPDERPAGLILVRSFSIGKYEVTQAQWRAVMNSNPSTQVNCDQCPVTNVSFDEVQNYLSQLNARSGKRYRLPTEAEWEYAARGGRLDSPSPYAGGSDVASVARFVGNSLSVPKPTGSSFPNGLNLYDFSGNVWEMCSDYYDAGYYVERPRENPHNTRPNAAGTRVIRGGSFRSTALNCRVANRSDFPPAKREVDVGFRVALD